MRIRRVREPNDLNHHNEPNHHNEQYNPSGATSTKLSSLKSVKISYFNDLFIFLWTSRKFPEISQVVFETLDQLLIVDSKPKKIGYLKEGQAKYMNRP